MPGAAGPEGTEEFAAMLRDLKDRSGLSYGALAKRLHASTSTLHRYCNGTVLPSEYPPVERLARVCRATPQELVELHRRWVLADAVRAAQAAATRAGGTTGPTAGPGPEPGPGPGPESASGPLTAPEAGPGAGPGTSPDTDPGTSPDAGPGTSPGTAPAPAHPAAPAPEAEPAGPGAARGRAGNGEPEEADPAGEPLVADIVRGPARPRRRRTALIASATVAAAVVATVVLVQQQASGGVGGDAQVRQTADVTAVGSRAGDAGQSAAAPAPHETERTTPAPPPATGTATVTATPTGTGASQHGRRQDAAAGPAGGTANTGGNGGTGGTGTDAAVPLTVTVRPYVYADPCSQHFLVDSEPAQVGPPAPEEEAPRWAAAYGAVSSGEQEIALTVQGTGAQTVVLDALHVRVVTRHAPLAWNDYSMGVGCGGGVPTTPFGVDLDAGSPAVAVRNGRPDFPYKVSESDPEVFYVTARTTAHDVRWDLALDWSSGGRHGTVRVDNGGIPFRTSADAGRPGYDYPLGSGDWIRREQ